MSLCEFVTKKAQCLQAMVDDLGLPVEVVVERAENIMITSQFDVITARAIGPLRKILPWFEDCWGQFKTHAVNQSPQSGLMKKAAAEELGLVDGLSIECVHSYPMPGRDNKKRGFCSLQFAGTVAAFFARRTFS